MDSGTVLRTAVRLPTTGADLKWRIMGKTYFGIHKVHQFINETEEIERRKEGTGGVIKGTAIQILS